MEILKTAFERLFLFVASLIPGGAAILLFGLGYPDLLADFWQIGYLEYKTKLAIVIVSAFLLGWSILVVYTTIVHWMGRLVGSVLQLEKNVEAKPWHSYRKKYPPGHSFKCELYWNSLSLQNATVDNFVDGQNPPSPTALHRVLQAACNCLNIQARFLCGNMRV
jgi:hypothetical protein